MKPAHHVPRGRCRHGDWPRSLNNAKMYVQRREEGWEDMDSGVQRLTHSRRCNPQTPDPTSLGAAWGYRNEKNPSTPPSCSLLPRPLCPVRRIFACPRANPQLARRFRARCGLAACAQRSETAGGRGAIMSQCARQTANGC
jgi:hypothetical protein